LPFGQEASLAKEFAQSRFDVEGRAFGADIRKEASMKNRIVQAVDKLGADFPNLNWNFQEHRIGRKKELISQWLGGPDEDIMVCIFKGREIHEKFHRQDFFFINYAYHGRLRSPELPL
jgi:hypothetical protein